MDLARQTAVLLRCCAGSNHAWCVGAAGMAGWAKGGEVKIMPSAASQQVLPGLFWALDGLSSANWGLDRKSSWSGSFRAGVYIQLTDPQSYLLTLICIGAC